MCANTAIQGTVAPTQEGCVGMAEETTASGETCEQGPEARFLGRLSMLTSENRWDQAWGGEAQLTGHGKARNEEGHAACELQPF